MFIVKFCFLVRDLKEIKITMIEHTCKSLINTERSKKNEKKEKENLVWQGYT